MPKAAACAEELAAQGVDAAQYTTAAWIADLDAVRAALGYDEDQPVGRLLRHARRAGVPAPASGPRAQHGPRRRRAAGDEGQPRRLAVARHRAVATCSTPARSRLPAAPRIPDLPAMLDAIRDRLGPTGRDVDADRSAHRRAADRAPHVRPRHRRAAAAHLRARALEPAARDPRPGGGRRLRPALRRRHARDRRPRRADEQRAALLGDLRGGRAARHAGRGDAGARRRPLEGAGHPRARGLRRLAEGREPGRCDDPGQQRRAGADPVRRARPGHAAGERRRGREDAAGEPPHRRARLRPHRVAARLRAAADRGVHRRPDLRQRSRRPASSISRRATGRRCGPTGSERARDRRRQPGQVVRPAPRGPRRRRRLLHRRRRRDHRPARPQRRRQDHAAAHARDADDPGRRQRDRRRPRRRPRPLCGAPAHRRAVGRARALSAADRAREHPLLRRAARPRRRRARCARRRADRARSASRRIADRRAQGFSQGERMKVAIARALVHDPADDPARRADQRPRHHEHARAARPPARAARRGQVPAVQLARDAGSRRAVRPHRDPRPRAGRRDRDGGGADRAGGRGVARGRLRARCSGPAKDWPHDAAPSHGPIRRGPHRRRRAQGDGRHLPRPPHDAGDAGDGDRGGPDPDAARAEPRRAPGGQGARAQAAGRRARARAGARRVPRAPAGDADACARGLRGEDPERRPRRRARDRRGLRRPMSRAASRGPCACIYDRSRDRARASIAEVESLLRAYNREWGRGRLLLRGVAAEVANPLDIESRDLATPQSSGRARAVPRRLLRALRRGDGRHGRGARHDGRRARARVAGAAADDARGAARARHGQVARRGRRQCHGGRPHAVRLLPDLALRAAAGRGHSVPVRPHRASPLRDRARAADRADAGGAPVRRRRGRTFKEAQSNVSVLLFVVSIMPIAQMFLQRKEPAWLLWIPISGQYALLSRALRGEALPPVELLQSYAVPVLLAAASLLAVARLFSRESALAGR